MEEMVGRMRRGYAVDNDDFDELYPTEVRERSSAYWTPVAVALRAAELLAPRRTMRVLDFGSGCGKLCIVGAIRTGAFFTGVEHRAHLVRSANAASRLLRVETTQFVHGSFEHVDVSRFDAIYFFNPFEENLFGRAAQLDWTVELSRPRFLRDASSAIRILLAARPGTRVVTYHGLGTRMPAGYFKVHRERIHTDVLELWIKGSSEKR